MKKTVHTQSEYGLRREALEFPMMVMLSLVYVCNAWCPNCPYNHSDIRASYSDALYMPENIFRKIADECGRHRSFLRMSGGGEPMLHPQALDFMLYAKDKGCKVGLITNGSRFTRQSLEALIGADIDAIEFSVDAGDEATYTKVRPGLSWVALNENIRRAVNIRNETHSPTRVIVSIINQKGVDIAAAEHFWSQLADKVQIRKYLTWGYNQDQSADNTPYLPPEEQVPCPWLFERLNVDSRGDVTLCGEDIAFSERFANVTTSSLKDIWLGPVFSELRRKHLAGRGREIPICAQCSDWRFRSWQYNYWKVLEDAASADQGSLS